MDALSADEIFLFEGFRLDHRGGGLFRADDSGSLVPVAIGSRALDLLALLVKRPGDIVTKDAIMNAVWPGLTVADSNLPTQIWALRRVLDHGRTQGSCIRTVAGRGYRFVAEVTCAGAEVRPAGPRISSGVATRQPIVAAPLTLVVLPFDNFSTLADQQSFADRITDDLTTDLSRFTSMRVTSRKTAFSYRNKPVDAKRIGRELGVRYVLEGSVHPSANHVRVNARLIDAETDTHLWAERFDRDPDSLFGVQDEIRKRATVSLYQALIGADASRQAEYPDPLEYVLRGRAATLKPRKREDYAQAIGMYERALELDPQFAEAKGWLADNLACRVLDDMADAAAADIARAEGLAEEAVAASPRTAFSHVAKGKVLLAQGRYNEAILEYETARAINPGWPHLYGDLSDCKLWTGSIQEAIPLAEEAIRMHERDYSIASWYLSIGRIHLVQSRTYEAIVWLEKARSANPQLPMVHAWLAAACALNGEAERAAAELAQARGLSRDGRYSSIARLQAAGRFGVPKIQALVENTFLAGLRKAGMPQE
jgi:TolB-like protein/tetratricopeptide (TPR) repeat protein